MRPSTTTSPTRRARRGGPASRYDESERGQHEERLHLLGEEEQYVVDAAPSPSGLGRPVIAVAPNLRGRLGALIAVVALCSVSAADRDTLSTVANRTRVRSRRQARSPAARAASGRRTAIAVSPGTPGGGFGGGPPAGFGGLGGVPCGTVRTGGFGGGGAGGLVERLDTERGQSRPCSARARVSGGRPPAIGANNAAGYQPLASGQAIMAIGGFNGTDPTPMLRRDPTLLGDDLRDVVAGPGPASAR